MSGVLTEVGRRTSIPTAGGESLEKQRGLPQDKARENTAAAHELLFPFFPLCRQSIGRVAGTRVDPNPIVSRVVVVRQRVTGTCTRVCIVASSVLMLNISDARSSKHVALSFSPLGPHSCHNTIFLKELSKLVAWADTVECKVHLM